MSHYNHKGRPGLVGGSLPKNQNLNNLFLRLKGGAGSGNKGHAGIPGHRGGSAPQISLISVGEHVKKLLGDKKAAAEYFSEIEVIDKTFNGAISKFLEKYPLNVLAVRSMGSYGDGYYQPSTKRLNVNTLENMSEIKDLKQGDSVPDNYGLKTGDKKEFSKAVFAHEFAHHIESKFDKVRTQEFYEKTINDSFRKDNKKVSKYAGTDSREYFAESFTAYHLAPNTLSFIAKQMVEDVMKKASEL